MNLYKIKVGKNMHDLLSQHVVDIVFYSIKITFCPNKIFTFRKMCIK